MAKEGQENSGEGGRIPRESLGSGPLWRERGKMLLGQKAQGERKHEPREGRGVEVAGLVEGSSGKRRRCFYLVVGRTGRV